MYIIIQCKACGNLLIARQGQKTKRCTYCTTRLDLRRVRLLAEATTARDASRIAMTLKDQSRPAR